MHVCVYQQGDIHMYSETRNITPLKIKYYIITAHYT